MSVAEARLELEAQRRGWWRTTFTSLSEPEYAWYSAGNIAFFMGMQMQQLLRGFLAFDLTGRVSSLGIMAASMALPMLVLAPIGGAVADRVNKRNLLIVTQTMAAAASLAMGLLILTGLIEFWQLVVISLVTGAVFSFNMPARQALVPQLVPQHKLMNAISLQMGGMNATRIVAPATAGVLIVPLGIGWVYNITTGLFLVAVASEFHLPKWGMVSQKTRSPFRKDLAGGIRYIASDPTLRLVMLAALLMPLFGFPIQQMLPVFARDVFDTGALGLGLLASAMGLGGLVGAIVSANLDTEPRKGRLMFLGGLLMGVFILAFAASSNFILGLVFLAAMGVGQMLFQAVNNTAIQAELPPEVRGRVMSVMMMSFGLMPLGVLPVTIAADSIGAQGALAISAGILLVVLFAMWGLSPRLRNLRQEQLARTKYSPVQVAGMVATGKITREEGDRLSGEFRRRAVAGPPDARAGPEATVEAPGSSVVGP